MSNDTPKDGDFAAWLEAKAATPPAAPSVLAEVRTIAMEEMSPQTLEDVLLMGQDPTSEFVEEFKALNEAPPVSDEELERQALEAAGEDGHAETPE